MTLTEHYSEVQVDIHRPLQTFPGICIKHPLTTVPVFAQGPTYILFIATDAYSRLSHESMTRCRSHGCAANGKLESNTNQSMRLGTCMPTYLVPTLSRTCMHILRSFFLIGSEVLLSQLAKCHNTPHGIDTIMYAYGEFDGRSLPTTTNNYVRPHVPDKM